MLTAALACGQCRSAAQAPRPGISRQQFPATAFPGARVGISLEREALEQANFRPRGHRAWASAAPCARGEQPLVVLVPRHGHWRAYRDHLLVGYRDAALRLNNTERMFLPHVRRPEDGLRTGRHGEAVNPQLPGPRK